MSTACQSPTTEAARQQIPPSLLFADPDETARKLRKAEKDRASKARRRAEAKLARAPERKEALSCAEAIKALLPQFPTLTGELNKFVTLLQKHGKVQPDRVRDVVELKLRQGCTNVDEICEETNLSELIILNTLEGMRALGTVDYRPRMISGRPTSQMVWVLTGKAPITTAVRP